ncbi:MAG: hypothetical protein M1820_000697 [Bogoriella megaspora]|nr:MAG: hypothetical protein M1820_000697 [Bogoriella megaspora]
MADHHPGAASALPHRPSYPDNSYPSPSLQNSYAFTPQGQQQGQPGDYRASSNSSMPQHPVNLPPIRSFDGQNQQSSQQPPSGYAASTTLPQPGSAMTSSYYHPQQGYLPPPPGPQHSSLAVQAAQMGMRYPVPPHLDHRNMSGGRHKKEIKRRTKTGCLTCRKRRIKCDEAHPACRNCQKSKRECLGYDPIFKQQPGPANLQPAPSASPQSKAETSSAGPTPPSYPSGPQNFPAASTAGYAPGFSSTSSPNPSSESAFNDYGTAIDPALGPGENGHMAGNHINQNNNSGDVYRSAAEMPYPSRGEHGLRHITAAYADSTLSEHNTDLSSATRLKMDELFALNNAAPSLPPPRTEPLPPDLIEEAKTIYEREYATGLDRLLETTWYSTTGLMRLTHYTQLVEEIDFALSEMRRVPSEDHDGQRRLESLEAKLVWDLACMCRMAPPTGFSPTPRDPEDQAKLAEVQIRLGIVEGLLCSSNPVGLGQNGADSVDFRKPTAYPEPKTQQIVYFSREFWRYLGLYVSYPPADPSPQTARYVEDTLTNMRGILQMLENRDVLYSIAIARHYGSRMPEFPDQGPSALSTDDTDVRNKVNVAKRFCEDESNGKGTTQVIQRICGMAVRGWSLWKKDSTQPLQ